MRKVPILKLTSKNNGVGIDAQLSAQLTNDQKHHRSMLMKILCAIQFLAQQGLPFQEVFRWNLSATPASSKR